MSISYQKLLDRLKAAGWTTYRIRKEGLLGQRTLANIKHGEGGLDSRTLNRLCEILDCQPGDLMEYIPDKD